MRFQLYFLLLFSIFAFSVCGGAEETNKNSNKSTPEVVNTAPSVAPSKIGALEKDVVTPTPVATVEAVTLKPLIAEFCKARQNKDEAALRKLYSAATLKNLIAESRAEGKKSITAIRSLEIKVRVFISSCI